MAQRIRLRPWQKEALELTSASDRPDFLAVATPGAGKTTFALTAAVHRLAAADGPRRLIVVAPTAHLKRQWAAAALSFGVHLDHQWTPADGPLPSDMHGVVTTYQQVAACAPLLARFAQGSMVIFDEIHHAGDDRAWGSAVRVAFGEASYRLSLSGTPFRSDTQSIPFLRYELEEARPDYEFGYGSALTSGRVVRPVYFPRTNGQMEWSAADGSIWSASFDDALDTARANQRLRAALSLDGDWLPTVMATAHQRLMDLRRTHPDAGGLVIATDQDHARGIAAALAWRHGVKPVIATSDDAGASDRIAAFAASDSPWLVAVRMVSEGVDIPRLRVGVFATTTTTELFFRQAVGRLVRWTPGVPAQRSYMYIPDDHRLRGWAYRIAEIRRHSLRRESSERGELDPAELDPMREEPIRDAEQLSLFAVISAVATDVHDPTHDRSPDHDEPDPTDDSLLVDLPVLTGPGPRPGPGDAGGAAVLTRREHKAQLRVANADLARNLVHKTGWSHAAVNAELNRLAGIRRITEATVEQLERRLRQGNAWYKA
ncbi:MAG TPA: DEAD/DEAH box helicase [Acidimicrobiales bacterium]|jgi:superfamily II DNA or RNA helicase|nr:DEAD/DEAH box helicase [Acidimicrobiales bacterium]